ncbi:MAG: creatininase family protein [Verrucomicrobiota bacterium]
MMWTDLGMLTWPAVREQLEAGPAFLVLPCGATEQHGPHLPLNTDTVIAGAVCEEASRLAGVPFLPPIAYSVSVGHTTKWPGTFSLSHETFISMVGELATWAENTGWRKLLLVNSHCGSDPSLRVAVDQVRTSRIGRFQIGMLNTFALTDEIRQAFTEDAEDFHANKAETDLMLHLAPETVRMKVVENDPDRTAGKVFSYPVSQTSLNGVTGNPGQGNAEAGRALFEKMVDSLAEILKRAAAEEPPLAGQAT